MSNAPFHCPDETVIWLPMPPTTNNLFISKLAGGHRRVKSENYKAWINAAGWKLATQRPPQTKERVDLVFELAESECLDTSDCSNRIKAAEDLLVTHRIIGGDSKRFVRSVMAIWSDNVEGCKVTVRPCA